MTSTAPTSQGDVSVAGAFVQILEFDTDRIDDWNGIVDHFVADIGDARTTRWSIVSADRDRPGRYVVMVEFPSYEQAMANSEHAATGAFVRALREICTGEPQFRNLDVVRVRPY